MTPAEFRAVAAPLYGERHGWIRDCAADLRVKRRSVERWLSGQHAVPATITRYLAERWAWRAHEGVSTEALPAWFRREVAAIVAARGASIHGASTGAPARG